jgi:two-component system, chemotaxis family, chemotaxis protein CheY
VSSRTIMTVDDSPSMRLVVSATLRKAGYRVVEAVDGRDALEKLDCAVVHMVLTDLNMPDMNGFELIRRLRTHPSCRFIPIMVVTAEPQAEVKQAGRAAGATGWIIKPFKPQQLLSVVRKVLGTEDL